MPRTRTRKQDAPAKPGTRRPAKKTTIGKALPVRQRPFMTDIQGYAVLAGRISGITTPHINEWTDHHDGTATRPLKDGTLHYHHPTRTLTWQATCRMGATHTYLITNPGLAHMARMVAARCTQLHHDFTDVEAFTADEQAEFAAWWAEEHGDQIEATTDDAPADPRPTPSWVRDYVPGETTTDSVPVPLPDRPARALADALAHSGTTAADTQPLSRDDIDACLAARAAADDETAKEHPQP